MANVLRTPNCRCNSQISIPDPFLAMAKQLNFLALDVFVLVNLNCLHSYDWGTGFLLRCGMPLVVVTMVKAVATWRTRATLGQCHDQGFEPSTRRRRCTLGALCTLSQRSLTPRAQ